MAGRSSMVRLLGCLVRVLFPTPGRGNAAILKVGMCGRGALLALRGFTFTLAGELAVALPTTAGVEVTDLEPI